VDFQQLTYNSITMEDGIQEPASTSDSHPQTAGPAWRLLWFLPHTALVYIIVNSCTPALAGWTRARLLPFLQVTSTSSSQFEFLFSHLLAFSFAPAFLAGLANFRRHRVAEFVWVVPAMVLAYKLATFSAGGSVLATQSPSAFHQYFEGGFFVPEYRDWHEFWSIVRSDPDMQRGMAQLQFTAPFYAGLGYSFGAWISLRTTLHQIVIDHVTKWEERKFGSRA
jgi:hypothetical protein